MRLTIIVVLFIHSFGFAQENSNTNMNDSLMSRSYVEVMPDFPGGHSKMIKYLGKNLHYPAEAQKNGVEGEVIVQFIIDEKGDISDVQVLQHLESGCDEEAKRVVESMPNWIPATSKGKPIKVYYKMPIKFKLH
ncbi:MAG: energy transducer TonB [Chitinophagales bacterium]